MLTSLCKNNINQLKNISYPGRGIITGLSPNSKKYIQVYWIMGRSENSRNRIFIDEEGFVKTEAFDKEKLVDPSLIIYYPIKFYQNYHIVSNGDQTDTIYEALRNKRSFETALKSRTFEPDSPNFTPRISGIINMNKDNPAYQLSILKTFNNNPNYCLRQFYDYEKGLPGLGHCIHTYASDGDPLPSFSGEPFVVELYDSIEQTAAFYWETLNVENKVSLVVKSIDIESNISHIFAMNKNQ
ncbi:IMP cyclohydrolase [Virgibacillus sp. DJP39]|uniref:IMP cyclohydrolase n=1 Tax=Virgibacillus sp. DJP39 TaxID=3409790 RepID=UPI003BB7FDEC